MIWLTLRAGYMSGKVDLVSFSSAKCIAQATWQANHVNLLQSEFTLMLRPLKKKSKFLVALVFEKWGGRAFFFF